MRVLFWLLLATASQPALAQTEGVPCGAMKMLVKQAPMGFFALVGEADRGEIAAKRLKGYDWCRIVSPSIGGQAYYCMIEGMELKEAERLHAQIGADMRRCLPEWEVANAGLGLPIAPLTPVAEDGIKSEVSGGRMAFGVVHLRDENRGGASAVSFMADFLPHQ
jgi:hypothetical protein